MGTIFLFNKSRVSLLQVDSALNVSDTLKAISIQIQTHWQRLIFCLPDVTRAQNGYTCIRLPKVSKACHVQQILAQILVLQNCELVFYCSALRNHFVFLVPFLNHLQRTSSRSRLVSHKKMGPTTCSCYKEQILRKYPSVRCASVLQSSKCWAAA